jgi:hypothetical protein
MKFAGPVAMFSPLFRGFDVKQAREHRHQRNLPATSSTLLFSYQQPRNVYPILRRRQAINCSLAFERALPQSDEFTCALL